MSTTKECSICASNYNSIIKKCVTCPKCDFEQCRQCIETYNLSNLHDFHCMNCKRTWEYEFILAEMTTASLKRIELHRQDVLFEREKYKIPSTQKYVVYHNNIKRLKSYDVIQLQKLNLYCADIHFNMVQEHRKLIVQNNDVELITTHEALLEKSKNECTNIIKNLNLLRTKINNWEHNYIIETSKEPENELHIIKNCCGTNCKGFIMSDWKCGICSIKICSKCHVIQSETIHECKEDDIKTAELIIKSTRPCPTCAILIHKINGCNQMWCPLCKCAFNYKTGLKDNGIIHNPHYYEWFRNSNNNVENNGVINSNRQINQNQFITHVRVAFVSSVETVNKLLKYNRLYGHVLYLMNTINIIDEKDEKTNLDIRLQWILNDIDEKEFKYNLFINDKMNKYNINIKQIYDLTHIVMCDISHKVLHCNEEKDVQELICEFETIVNYCNTCLYNTSKLYKKKLLRI